MKYLAKIKNIDELVKALNIEAIKHGLKCADDVMSMLYKTDRKLFNNLFDKLTN